LDNVQFAAMMATLDNTASMVNKQVSQGDAFIGLLLVVIFAAAWRWHL